VSLPHRHADGGADGAAVEGEAEEAEEVTIDERADEPLKANDQRTALARMRLLCNALKAKLTPLDKRSGMYSPNQPSPGTQFTCACGGVCDFVFAVCVCVVCVCVCVCCGRRLEDDRGSDEGQIGKGH
jgi:hypothetical protein